MGQFREEKGNGKSLSHQNSIIMVDWSALPQGLGFPFPRASTERCVEVACPKTAHTHSVRSVKIVTHQSHPLLCCRNSLWRAIWFFFQIFRVPSPPRLRHPAALVQELSNDYHIVAEYILDHSFPVDLDVWGEVLPPPQCPCVPPHRGR